MIAFTLIQNAEDIEMVEFWAKYSGRPCLVAIMHMDWIKDDSEIYERLENGESVKVSVRAI